MWPYVLPLYSFPFQEGADAKEEEVSVVDVVGQLPSLTHAQITTILASNLIPSSQSASGSGRG